MAAFLPMKVVMLPRTFVQRLAHLRLPILIILILMASATRTGFAMTELNNSWQKNGFQYSDGAMPVYRYGDYVEPYFSVKALLVAHRMGLDVRLQAEAFAKWLLPRQQADGRFARYCRYDFSDTPLWLDCGRSDADDAIAALWCALIVELLPQTTFDQSCLRSLDLLAKLWNPKQQVYRSLLDHPFSQFADNIEVYFALQRLQAINAKGRFDKAFIKHRSQLSLSKLKSGIEKTFFYSFQTDNFPLKANDHNPIDQLPAFYPEGVAPLYVWIYQLQPQRIALRGWAQWKKKYLAAWQAGQVDRFPWGLVAVVADIHDDSAISTVWLASSSLWRDTGQWNLLEEAVWMGLEYKAQLSKNTKN